MVGGQISTRLQSHPCTALATHNAANTHLEIIELILHDCQFLLNQQPGIFFVLESLHYFTLDLLSCVLFFLQSFFQSGGYFLLQIPSFELLQFRNLLSCASQATSPNRTAMSSINCIFVALLFGDPLTLGFGNRVPLHFRPTQGVFRRIPIGTPSSSMSTFICFDTCSIGVLSSTYPPSTTGPIDCTSQMGHYFENSSDLSLLLCLSHPIRQFQIQQSLLCLILHGFK